MRVKLHGKTHVLEPGDAITIPPDTPHTPAARQRASPGRDPRPPRRRAPASTSFFERLGETRSTTASASRSRARRREVRARARRGGPRRAAEPEDPAADRARLARRRVHVRRRVGRRRAARGRLRHARRRHDLPGSGGSRVYIERPPGRRVHPPALQGPPALPPAHAHADRPTPSARTGSRARPTATCAARGIWTLSRERRRRHPRALRLARARRPPAAASSSRRSCGPPCAGTTTGRSPARWRASSPTRASVRS